VTAKHQPTAAVTPTPLHPGGWSVHARPGRAHFALHRTGSPPLRLRLLGQRTLSERHIRALQALQLPSLVHRLRPGAKLFVPRTWRGQRNTGDTFRYFSLRLAGDRPLQVELVGPGTLKGTGLVETIRRRLVDRDASPIGWLRQTPEGDRRAQEQALPHQQEGLQPDPAQHGARPGQGLDQPGFVLPAGALDQEPAGR
jgi:hypothetical protein